MKIKLFLITVIFTFLSIISSWANSTTAIAEPITSIVVKKSDRKMYLFNGEKVLRRYRIGLGFSPKGGDIFIHGRDKSPKWWKRDWTFGCIAIRNHEMDEIYSAVDIGTPIFILP